MMETTFLVPCKKVAVGSLQTSKLLPIDVLTRDLFRANVTVAPSITAVSDSAQASLFY